MILQEKALEIKYEFIVERLLKTIKVYSVSFDELPQLSNDIKELMARSNTFPYLMRLETICHYLEIMGTNKVIIKLFHEALTADCVALKEDKLDLAGPQVYWD
ncbi:hypothetical protein [Adhaeribacter aquaticus]|uniref:hypothetical protein n=1 Tax=Adhaeribacter aquaticus TaxID=299567 RepID=UPI0012FC9CB2|nr:hypothetical protein [Adhaeribacter aquaticus]